MGFGSLDVFSGGLVRLIGPPRMVGGQFRTQMEHEHCRRADSQTPFLRSMSKCVPIPT